MRDETDAIKHDNGKLRHDLVPWDAFGEVLEVLHQGANHYGVHNWTKGMAWSRLFNALCRHVFAWWKGENLDRDTGFHHLAHAICCALFLLAYALRKIGNDDRFAQKNGLQNDKLSNKINE